MQKKNVRIPAGAPSFSWTPQFQFSPRISATSFCKYDKTLFFVKFCRKKNVKCQSCGPPTCDGGTCPLCPSPPPGCVIGTCGGGGGGDVRHAAKHAMKQLCKHTFTMFPSLRRVLNNVLLFTTLTLLLWSSSAWSSHCSTVSSFAAV